MWPLWPWCLSRAGNVGAASIPQPAAENQSATLGGLAFVRGRKLIYHIGRISPQPTTESQAATLGGLAFGAEEANARVVPSSTPMRRAKMA